MKKVIMKRKILFAILLLQFVVVAVSAQNKTLIISESGLPYTEQSWFAYGLGNPIDESDITGSWSQGKRVVSAAYTSEGWLILVAKNNGFTRQTFTINEEWPGAWIESKTREGYAVTSLARSEKQWLVVMSQGSGISRQVIWQNSWSELSSWITEQKGLGYFITDLAYDGKQWTVVMSQNSKYASQGYFWASTTNELMGRIQADVWGKGFNLHQVVYGEDHYVAVFGNFLQGDDRFQNLQVNPDDPKEYIRQQWERGIGVAYVGGGWSKTKKSKKH